MMPLADILFLAIVVYLLYRFVFNFLLPVFRATRQVREQFRNMQGPANDVGGSSQRPFSADPSRPGQVDSAGGRPGQAANKRSSKPPAEDYIDFEEIK
jgi:hypothetical protein